MKRIGRKLLAAGLTTMLILLVAGCSAKQENEPTTPSPEATPAPETAVEQKTGNDEAAANEPQTPSPGTTTEQEEAGEKNGEIYILVTSDIHCGIDSGFGFAGLKQIRDNLTKEGYETILVDDGDAIQGRPVGTVFKGEKIIELMNAAGYDVAIPGNHEFDYGMERFLELSRMTDFPYISCNFNRKGELIFDPYVIKEVSGVRIAFVGVSTPDTLRTSTPSYFKAPDGEYIYGFMQDKTGEALYAAVQDAVDSARKEGADIVCVMGHLGNEAECEPWTYADVISNTTGIDVFFDGHSHDTDKVTMTDKEGREVTRIAVGTEFGGIGYCHITAEGEIDDTDMWSWNNEISAPELLDIRNDMRDMVDAANDELSGELDKVVAGSDVDLTISDPVEKDEDGKAIRIIRRSETNLGDLVADAYRDQSGADIAFVNGGGIRANIAKGDVTYGDIISVHPFGNMLCVIEVTGQQILDALEWGSRSVPGENGGFIQVSGLSYEIDSSVDNPCREDENAMFAGISGKRRVMNVMVGGEPLVPSKKYTLAGHDFMLLSNGDGYTMFEGAPLLQDRVKLDNQVLIDYIINTLDGKIGEEYSDPFGQGRITIRE